MNALNNFFKKIYCINLDRRPDRWEHASEQFQKFGINVERFSAIDHEELDNIPPNIKRGAYACTLSHCEIIEKCKNDNVENVLIFEDDVVLDDDILNVFENNINHIPRWDMIYFGGYHIHRPTHIDKNIYKLHYSFAMQCYACNHTMYDILLKLENPICFDASVAEIHNTHDCFLLAKDDGSSLSKQYPNFSDIENGYKDYTNIL